MDREAVDVLFRVMRGEREPIALFPGIPGDCDRQNCLCYVRLGQHGTADLQHCIRDSRPATEAEYAPLARELERLGYTLRIVQRATRRHRGARSGELART